MPAQGDPEGVSASLPSIDRRGKTALGAVVSLTERDYLSFASDLAANLGLRSAAWRKRGEGETAVHSPGQEHSSRPIADFLGYPFQLVTLAALLPFSDVGHVQPRDVRRTLIESK